MHIHLNCIWVLKGVLWGFLLDSLIIKTFSLFMLHSYAGVSGFLRCPVDSSNKICALWLDLVCTPCFVLGEFIWLRVKPEGLKAVRKCVTVLTGSVPDQGNIYSNHCLLLRPCLQSIPFLDSRAGSPGSVQNIRTKRDFCCIFSPVGSGCFHHIEQTFLPEQQLPALVITGVRPKYFTSMQ